MKESFSVTEFSPIEQGLYFAAQWARNIPIHSMIIFESVATRRLLSQWLNFRSLNKDFTLQHSNQGTSPFIQSFFLRVWSMVKIDPRIISRNPYWWHCHDHLQKGNGTDPGKRLNQQEEMITLYIYDYSHYIAVGTDWQLRKAADKVRKSSS